MTLLLITEIVMIQYFLTEKLQQDDLKILKALTLVLPTNKK